MQVTGAQGTRLEQNFPFGVAIQLFEPRWISADASERERLVQGPAHWAGELLAGSPVTMQPFPGDQGYAVIHGLFRLAYNLTRSPHADGDSDNPLVMLVDDAQWADQPSLRFLAYLAQRILELPIALLIAVREGELSSDRQALAALNNVADSDVLRPDRLSQDRRGRSRAGEISPRRAGIFGCLRPGDARKSFPARRASGPTSCKRGRARCRNRRKACGPGPRVGAPRGGGAPRRDAIRSAGRCPRAGGTRRWSARTARGAAGRAGGGGRGTGGQHARGAAHLPG